jgi:hypothetical protein
MYDPKCEELSEYFLTGQNIPPNKEQEMIKLLAQTIQDEVETFITCSLPHLIQDDK